MYEKLSIYLKENDYNFIMTQLRNTKKSENDKGKLSEATSGYITANYLIDENERIMFNTTAEQQLIADFIVYNYKTFSSCLEDRERQMISNIPIALADDYYFFESKTSCVTGNEAKLFMPMKELLIRKDNKNIIIPYRQSNTGTDIGWAMQSSQPRKLSTLCIDKQDLYVFGNWQQLCLDSKEMYYRYLNKHEVRLPFDRNPKSPDYYYDKEGKRRIREVTIDGITYLKHSDCMILHLEKMYKVEKYRRNYGMKAYHVEFKPIG